MKQIETQKHLSPPRVKIQLFGKVSDAFSSHIDGKNLEYINKYFKKNLSRRPMDAVGALAKKSDLKKFHSSLKF